MLRAAGERHHVVEIDSPERFCRSRLSPRGSEATERFVHIGQNQFLEPLEIHPLHSDPGRRRNLAPDETRDAMVACVFCQELQQDSADQARSAGDDSGPR